MTRAEFKVMFCVGGMRCDSGELQDQVIVGVRADQGLLAVANDCKGTNVKWVRYESVTLRDL